MAQPAWYTKPVWHAGRPRIGRPGADEAGVEIHPTRFRGDLRHFGAHPSVKLSVARRRSIEARRRTTSRMTISTTLFRTLADLRQYVWRILCEPDQLELHAFPLVERMLVRNSEPCGMYFCLHGPRAVRFSAIWDAVRNVVIFYNAAGERFHLTRLMESPCLLAAA